MNKTTSILLLVFVLLGAGAWWFSQKGTTKNTLGVERDWYMAIDDIDQVGKVFFANRDGKTVTIERKGEEWIYNNTYKARPNAVDLMLQVLHNVRLKYRPPHAAVKPVVRYMATGGIKVEVYDRQGDKMRTMYIGGGTTDERGTYMMLDGSDNPYVMHMPTWEGNLRTRFFFDDKNWRDKTVFSEKQDNIAKVSIDYPENKAQSFTLERQADGFQLTSLYNPAQTGKANASQVEAYLEGFKSLGAEGFENNNEKIESIVSKTPFCTVSLTNKQDETTTISVFTLPRLGEDGTPIAGQEIERYIVKSSTGDFYLIQQRVFGKIFWAYDALVSKK